MLLCVMRLQMGATSLLEILPFEVAPRFSQQVVRAIIAQRLGLCRLKPPDEVSFEIGKSDLPLS